MAKIRKCTICGEEFLSHNGIEVCSEQCREERSKIQNRKSNKRRAEGLSNSPFTKTCPICGKKFETLRNTYCSSNCSNIALFHNKQRNSRMYYKEHREEIVKKVLERKCVS